MKNETKLCRYCEKPLGPSVRKNHVYCSNRCQLQYRKYRMSEAERVAKTSPVCLYCGVALTQVRRLWSNYCTTRCSNLHKYHGITKAEREIATPEKVENCLCCGSPLAENKCRYKMFCSRRCYAKFRRHSNLPKVDRERAEFCLACGKKIDFDKQTGTCRYREYCNNQCYNKINRHSKKERIGRNEAFITKSCVKEKHCLHCGKPIEQFRRLDKKYCNKKCAWQYFRLARKDRLKTLERKEREERRRRHLERARADKLPPDTAIEVYGYLLPDAEAARLFMMYRERKVAQRLDRKAMG